MLVTKIEPQSKKKSRVLFENGEDLVLCQGEIVSYRITEGGQLSEEAYAEITERLLPKRATKRAMNLLLIQPRTRQELINRLKRDGYPDTAVEAAISYVERFHYVDDRRYVEQYLAGPGAGKGKQAVMSELSRKGIDHRLAEEVLESTEDRDEYAIASRCAAKKLGLPRKLEPSEYRRAAGFLARKGFAPSVICKVLEEFQQSVL